MGTITVYSPFDGTEVKIRPEDAGKAIRDGEGKLFYALPRSDGQGYYGAPTRAGGARDEERAMRQAERIAATKQAADRSGATSGQVKKQGSAAASHSAAGGSRQQPGNLAPLHSRKASDRRAESRPAGRGLSDTVRRLMGLVILGGAAWLFFFGPLKSLGRGLIGWLSGLAGF